MIVAVPRGRPWPIGWLVVFAASFAAVGCGRLPLRRGEDVRSLSAAQEADVHFAFGRTSEANGDPERAESSYREAARRDPKRADAPHRLAVLLDRQGKFAESGPLYEAALKLAPGDPEIFCDRGYSLALQGRPAEAELALRQAIAARPELARAHNNLGLVLGRSGRDDEALAEFRRAGLAEPEAHLNLAYALGQDRRWADARHHAEIAKALGSPEPALEGLIARGGAAAPSDAGVLRAGGPAAGATGP